MQTQDPVLLSFAQAVLKDVGIPSHVLDANISIAEGSVGILPRRLCVAADDKDAARRALLEAGLEKDLN